MWVPVGLQLADRPLTHSLIGPRTAEGLVGLRLADRTRLPPSTSRLLALALGRPRADRYVFFFVNLDFPF